MENNIISNKEINLSLLFEEIDNIKISIKSPEKKKRGGAPFNKSKRGFDKSRKPFKNRTNAKKRMHRKSTLAPAA